MDSKIGLGGNCPFTSLVDTPRNQSEEQLTNQGCMLPGWDQQPSLTHKELVIISKHQ